MVKEKPKKYLVGVLYMPPFQYGEYVYEKWKPTATEKQRLIYEIDCCQLSIDEKWTLARVLGYEFRSMDDTEFQKFSVILTEKTKPIREIHVGDVLYVCRYGYTDYNTDNHEQIWELAKLRRIR